jgi:hypothetical protein
VKDLTVMPTISKKNSSSPMDSNQIKTDFSRNKTREWLKLVLKIATQMKIEQIIIRGKLRHQEMMACHLDKNL